MGLVSYDDEGFDLHSGERSPFLINVHALDADTIRACAAWLAEKLPPFGSVVGIPAGGIRLARALREYATWGPELIVDDVLTTGRSMEEKRGASSIGAVLFARGPCPEWITPLFQMREAPDKEHTLEKESYGDGERTHGVRPSERVEEPEPVFIEKDLENKHYEIIEHARALLWGHGTGMFLRRQESLKVAKALDEVIADLFPS